MGSPRKSVRFISREPENSDERYKFDTCRKPLGAFGQTTKEYEDESTRRCIEEPATTKLLIVVSELLTGFDAPICTCVYLDSELRDHNLFQAICRTNRHSVLVVGDADRRRILGLKRDRMAVRGFRPQTETAMNTRSTVVATALAVLLTSPLALAPDIRITYLYDNTSASPALNADWGFACLIEAHGRTVLFDTGTKPDILRNNVAALKLDVGRIQALVFSHPHGDHTLGAGALPTMPGLPVYVGEHFRLPTQADAELARIGARRIIVSADRGIEVFPGFTAGPEMVKDDIYEIPLAIDTPSGLVVLVGCSHPGIVAMLKRVSGATMRPIHAVIGGFHLMQTPAEDVRRIIGEFKSMGVTWAGPTHCTGPEAIRLFREAYGGHFVEGGAGTVVTLPKRSAGRR